MYVCFLSHKGYGEALMKLAFDDSFESIGPLTSHEVTYIPRVIHMWVTFGCHSLLSIDVLRPLVSRTTVGDRGDNHGDDSPGVAAIATTEKSRVLWRTFHDVGSCPLELRHNCGGSPPA